MSVFHDNRMSPTDSVSRTIDDAVTSSRDRREEGRTDGRVKRYGADEERDFESGPERFVERTPDEPSGLRIDLE